MLNTKHMTVGTGLSRKLMPIWLAPYQITAKVNRKTYTLRIDEGAKRHATYNTTMLNPYRGPQRFFQQPPLNASDTRGFTNTGPPDLPRYK
jgi:hypothetical protein